MSEPETATRRGAGHSIDAGRAHASPSSPGSRRAWGSPSSQMPRSHPPWGAPLAPGTCSVPRSRGRPSPVRLSRLPRVLGAVPGRMGSSPKDLLFRLINPPLFLTLGGLPILPGTVRAHATSATLSTGFEPAVGPVRLCSSLLAAGSSFSGGGESCTPYSTGTTPLSVGLSAPCFQRFAGKDFCTWMARKSRVPS